MFTYSKLTTTYWPDDVSELKVGPIFADILSKMQPQYDFGPIEEAWKRIDALNTIRKQQGL